MVPKWQAGSRPDLDDIGHLCPINKYKRFADDCELLVRLSFKMGELGWTKSIEEKKLIVSHSGVAKMSVCAKSAATHFVGSCQISVVSDQRYNYR